MTNISSANALEEVNLSYPIKTNIANAEQTHIVDTTNTEETPKINNKEETSQYATPPSKAEGVITKDIDGNGNKIKDAQKEEFITIRTKNGKNLHLYIDRQNNKVLLTTEVSEQDLLSLVDKNQMQEIEKKEEVKTENKEEKKQEQPTTQLTTMHKFIICIVLLATGGLGYLWYITKKKKEEEVIDEEDDY